MSQLSRDIGWLDEQDIKIKLRARSQLTVTKHKQKTFLYMEIGERRLGSGAMPLPMCSLIPSLYSKCWGIHLIGYSLASHVALISHKLTSCLHVWLLSTMYTISQSHTFIRLWLLHSNCSLLSFTLDSMHLSWYILFRDLRLCCTEFSFAFSQT